MNLLKKSPNARVPHWKSASQFYGLIPAFSGKGGNIEAGPIELRVGRYGKFGLNHIWYRHSTEVLQHSRVDLEGLTADDKVLLVQRFVADIVMPGAPIHCCFDNIAGNHRVQVLKTPAGIAILQPKLHRDQSLTYSIITAYKKGVAEGARVGRVTPFPPLGG